MLHIVTFCFPHVKYLGVSIICVYEVEVFFLNKTLLKIRVELKSVYIKKTKIN